MGDFETIEAGGVRARLFVAGGPSTADAGVLVFHPWWGLNHDVIGYGERLAAAGFAVVVPDLFDGHVATTIEAAEGLIQAVDEAEADAIALAAADELAGRVRPAAKLAALGFSFGVHWAMWTPAQRERLAASVVYYGTTGGPVLAGSRAPVLGHFAETDPYEPEEGIAAFAAELRSAGRDAAIHRYPGTGHWFAEPSRDAYRPEAAELAFERTVAFLRQT
jgi:carboxymethylenebutenolidase